MRIGFVSEALPYLPCRDGFRIYGANLIRWLSRSHEIDLICLVRQEDDEYVHWAKQYTTSLTTVRAHRHRPFARVANAVASYGLGRPRHYRKTLNALVEPRVASGRWDILHVEGPFVGGLVARAGLPKILSLHDSTAARWREIARREHSVRARIRAWLAARYASRYERLVCPRFDRSVVVTEKERAALRRVAPDAQVEVIGNGTDVEYFRRVPGPRPGALVVFHGNLGYLPNVAAGLELAHRIFPLIRAQVSTAECHIVGAVPTPEVRSLSSLPGVKIVPDPEDIRPAMAAASVYACAVRHGGGIKNKLLEAMAMGLPIVSYPEATSGIECADGTHLLLARTVREFADRTVELLQAPERALALGREARRLMEERYSWESRATAYELLYEAVLAESHPYGQSGGGRVDHASVPKTR
jgi:glycosyltransferase involved in cell wall biosynthesis